MLSTSMITESAEHGDQRVSLPVIGSSGIIPLTTNYTISLGTDFPVPGRELFLSNDSTGDITIVVTCAGGTLSWVLHAGETFNERMPPFTQVVVTATGNWRWYIRGNLT